MVRRYAGILRVRQVILFTSSCIPSALVRPPRADPLPPLRPVHLDQTFLRQAVNTHLYSKPLQRLHPPYSSRSMLLFYLRRHAHHSSCLSQISLTISMHRIGADLSNTDCAVIIYFVAIPGLLYTHSVTVSTSLLYSWTEVTSLSKRAVSYSSKGENGWSFRELCKYEL